jgi:thiamine biosynthesis lipoprotein
METNLSTVRIRNIYLSVLALLLLTACQQESQESLYKKQYFIFGTIIDVLIWHNNDSVVNKALNKVELELNAMHTQWHAWKAGRLSEINEQLYDGKTVKLTEEEAQFINTTKQLSIQSMGYFNPAIGELINLWGFHTDAYPITEPPPEDSEIRTFLQNLPTMNDIHIINNMISSSNQHLRLDYGGVAKGYAIDKAINILKSHGIENAIVNAGGDLRSIGSKGDKDWKVAIRKPNSDQILAVIAVNGDESIFTSGNYERYKEFNGTRYAHIIDPQTGYGVKDIVSATVIISDNDNDGTKADAAATALIVAGSNNWQKVAQSMQLDQILLIDAKGTCMATQKIIARLEKTELECNILL